MEHIRELFSKIDFAWFDSYRLNEQY